jgi:hypothetical protein
MMTSRLLLVLAAGLTLIALAAPNTSTAAGGNWRTCHYFRARNWQNTRRTDSWRAYVKGAVRCGGAIPVLKTVIDGGGVIHQGTSDATSWTDVGKWRCPAGEMNTQFCNRPKRPPYHATAVAMDCRTQSCPARYPF